MKSFINLQVLQKLNSQKPFWDKARLSSLVNKRFGLDSASVLAQVYVGWAEQESQETRTKWVEFMQHYNILKPGSMC